MAFGCGPRAWRDGGACAATGMGSHAITLNWGEPLITRFTAAEGDALWERFRSLDARLQAPAEHLTPGYQNREPMRYYFEDLPEPYSIDDFTAERS